MEVATEKSSTNKIKTNVLVSSDSSSDIFAASHFGGRICQPHTPSKKKKNNHLILKNELTVFYNSCGITVNFIMVTLLKWGCLDDVCGRQMRPLEDAASEMRQLSIFFAITFFSITHYQLII